MGVAIAKAAEMDYLQCDIERGIMIMAQSNLRTGIFNIFPRPNLMRAMVTLQLRHRYNMWRAERNRRLAVAMAEHPRLGRKSALRVLDADVLRLICKFTH